MLQITCPWCGPRAETEFSYGGESHVVRPAEPEKLTDAQWVDYLFMRKNAKGTYGEQWCHAAGCRRWFNAERDTVTNAFSAVQRLDEAPGGKPQ